MRGKKLPITFKLMGVRGKKGPSSMSFFGTRGKRNGIPIISDDISDEDLTTIVLYLLANSNKDIKNNLYDNAEFESSDSGKPEIQTTC